MATDSGKQKLPEDPLAKSDGMDISEEDRREVLKSIENIASEHRIDMGDGEVFALKGVKSGVLFPILVNILSLAVVAIVVFLLSRSFQSETTTLAVRGLEFSSLEGQLIRELQQESQDQISAKDREIGDFEQRLDDLERQRQELGASLGTKVDTRQDEYNQQIQAALEAEKRRLESQGVNISEVNRLLAIQEEELRNTYTRQLAAYQEELIREQETLDADIGRLQNEYSDQIDELRAQRSVLVEDFREQEVSLRDQLEEQAQVLADTNEAVAGLQTARGELARLSAEREAATAIESQLLGIYDRVRETINRGDWATGLGIIQQARSFLNEESVISAGNLTARRTADLFVFSTIEQYIQNIIRSEESANTVSQQIEVLSRIRANGQRADDAIANNNVDLATNIYSQTMRLLPELTVASQSLVAAERDQLNESFATALEDRRDAIATLIQTAEIAIGRGDYTLALNSFDRALQVLPELEDSALSINSNLVSVGYGLANLVVQQDSLPNAIFRRSQLDPDIIRVSLSEQITTAVSAREAELFADLSDAGTELSSLQESYEGRLESLTGDLSASFDEQIVVLRRDLEDRTTELASIRDRSNELEQLSTDLQREVNRLQVFAEQVSAIQSQYSEYQVNLSEIQSTGDLSSLSTILRARQELENFIGSRELVAIVPGFSQAFRGSDALLQQAGRDAGLSEVSDVVAGFFGQATLNQRQLFLESELQSVRQSGDGIMEAFLMDLLDVVR